MNELRIRKIFDAEASAVSRIPITSAYDRAVDLIHQHVHGDHGKLITSGMGKAGQIAHNMATTFSSTGTPSVFLHPAEAQHGDLGVMQKNDVLLVVSNSGKTRELVELIELKNNLYPAVPVIAISGAIGSPLTLKADCVIATGAPEEVCPLGLSPTTSTTVMTVIGDALVVLLMEMIGFSAIDYARRHHGGYLGTKSKELAQCSTEELADGVAR